MLTVQLEQDEDQTFEQAVEADIRKFEAAFVALGNDSLVRSEIAILKTYWYWKVKGELHAKAGH